MVEEVRKTRYRDSKNRKIVMVKSGNSRKYLVRMRNSDGKFVKVHRKAMTINGGRNIRTLSSVPKPIRSNKSLSSNGPRMYEMTLNGLIHWHKNLFEQFGWMILVRAKGYGYKIPTYKRSIQEFIKTSEKLHKDYQSVNIRRDVKIMMKNVKVLKKFSEML